MVNGAGKQNRGLMKRPWVLLLLLLLLLVSAGWSVTRLFGASESGSWVAVEQGDLVLDVEVTGTLRATDTSILGPPQVTEIWEFKISFMAPEGEEVAAGTNVLGFDTMELEQHLLQQQAEADQAAKQIEKTERTLTLARRSSELQLAEAQASERQARLKLDVPQHLTTAMELSMIRLDLELATLEVAYLEERIAVSETSAEAQMAALQNQKQRAERQVYNIRKAIGKMMRQAPRAATVIYSTDWRGDKHKVGDKCWRSRSILELPDLTSMEAEGWVEEADTGTLANDQKVTLYLDAHPDLSFIGRIDSIWRTLQRRTWRNTLKYARLRIELDETDTQRMRPGMRFRGQVEVERVADVMLIPLDAVFLKPEGPVVYQRSMLGHREIAVSLGRRNEDRVELLDGLSEGDMISLTDPTLEDGNG